jgi:hypothetical protein
MSFIYNYFAGDNSTPAEKENATALKAIIKDHKTVLKVEYKRFEIEYKQAVKEAEAEYKRAKEQAKGELFRKTMDMVKREIDVITATDEYANSDAKTKSKIDNFKSWMSSAEAKHFGEKEEDLAVFDIANDTKNTD